jgi:polar amino acid transport system substrate-binding protein
MKQVVQNLGSGELSVVDAPAPVRSEGYVLVGTRASLISAGTERSTVQAAQATLLGKARQRPDQVRQVLDNVRREGLKSTISKVQSKLEEPKALGYSSAGVVLEGDPGAPHLQPGTRVACGGGGYATHASIVAIPRNLVVPLPDSVPYDEGAFATVGAIAMQGLRRAHVEIGETVLVVGLGLLGQIMWQLLAGAGCRPIGTDVDTAAVERAQAMGLETALVTGRADVAAVVAEMTGGRGIDAVLVTAATKSREPLELAGAVSRERGRVVIVGAVPIEVPRDPYYMKELDLLVSRSYGPGRYDRSYEEGGQDYPFGHVRWTEGRNMEAVVDAIAGGALDVKPLITHRFPIDQAPAAYEIVSGKNPEPHVGIVLTYDEPNAVTRRVVLRERPAAISEGTVGVAMVGAGSFATSYLLPPLTNQKFVSLVGVATSRGYTAVHAARKFGFIEASSDAEALVQDPRVHAVIIATRHDKHAPLVAATLRAGRHVFVEKPLATTPEQLREVVEAAGKTDRIVQVGFNRRFSPLAVRLREILARTREPTTVVYRVNAGPLPNDHWLLDPEEGGGRIIGEGCHFIDLVQFLTGAEPRRVAAHRLGDDRTGATMVLLELSDGSAASLIYQANASSLLPKERIEAYSGGSGGVIDDWKGLEVHEGRKRRRAGGRGQQKGYAEEIGAFFGALKTGTAAIAFDSQVLTTLTTFAIVESLARRQPVDIDVADLS